MQQDRAVGLEMLLEWPRVEKRDQVAKFLCSAVFGGGLFLALQGGQGAAI
ncbi:hypothetical protein [Roseovarius amoyensis]|nr:hypothetical protein [Roseovarius amoyensis]